MLMKMDCDENYNLTDMLRKRLNHEKAVDIFLARKNSEDIQPIVSAISNA